MSSELARLGGQCSEDFRQRSGHARQYSGHTRRYSGSARRYSEAAAQRPLARTSGRTARPSPVRHDRIAMVRWIETLSDRITAVIMRRPQLVRRAMPMIEWYLDQSGYRQLGLKLDDLHLELDPTVQKALKRLPPKEAYDRVYRLRRALQVSAEGAGGGGALTDGSSRCSTTFSRVNSGPSRKRTGRFCSPSLTKSRRRSASASSWTGRCCGRHGDTGPWSSYQHVDLRIRTLART